jgi:tRNA(Ile)-lysidine synthase
MDLAHRVRRTIRHHDLGGPDTRVLAALSGGSDSVALVELLRDLTMAGELQLVALAHFNHRLRPEADADQRFCVEIGRRLGLPVLVEGADIATLARQQHRSIEDAGRTARHAFFARARVEAGAGVVALGHTRDDQAETFLLRLLRGAGSQGLASMYPRHGAIIRPLLDCRRDELAAFLAARGVGFVEDASNADVSIPRNRVRAELLPFIRDRFNPAVIDVLADAADVAREDWAWLSQAAAALERQIVTSSAEESAAAGNEINGPSRIEQRYSRLVLDAGALAAAPVAVARAALRRVMMQTSGGRFVGFAAVERALELSRGNGANFDAAGQRVQRIGTTIVLTGRPHGAIGRFVESKPAVVAFRYQLPIPGEVVMPEAGSVISAEEVSGGSVSIAVRGQQPGNPVQPRTVQPPAPRVVADVGDGHEAVVVRRDLCGTLLAVRNRRPGDAFRPAGLGGRKTLQNFFVDRKVERRQRDLIPLVVDESDRIVWVAGHAMSDEFRVTDPAQAVIILRLKGVGGAV